MAKKKAKKRVIGLGHKITELTQKVVSLENENRNHKTFLSNLLAVLGKTRSVDSMYGIFAHRFEETRVSDEQEILKQVVLLKENFAREDEGTKCQAEHISNLDDALHTLMNDPKRTMEVNKEFELVKMGFVKIIEQGQVRWVKNNNNNQN